jgi:predicted ATP-dependent serine protease
VEAAARGASAPGGGRHPRLEAVVAPTEATPGAERPSFGMRDIDALLGGGLTLGPSTAVAGSPGAGKALLGLHFVAERLRREAGLPLAESVRAPTRARDSEAARQPG